MRTFVVSANLLKVCFVHNVASARDAIIAAQTHVFEHKPSLWEEVKDAEWLADSDIHVDPSQPIVEFCL